MSRGTTENHSVTWGKEQIEFRLRRRLRRTLAITVQPDLSVLVTAPASAALEAVLGKVRKRAGWVRRQQKFFREFLPTAPPRRYVSGETHLYLGRQYRLKLVAEGSPSVRLKGRFIWMHGVRPGDAERVRSLVAAWYLERAKERFVRSLAQSAARLGPRLRSIPAMHVRRMPKRWGSWTKRSGISLNPELVKAPASCIDYVVTHELCHLIHPNHGREFYALLRKAMPDWEVRKARLESILA